MISFLKKIKDFAVVAETITASFGIKSIKLFIDSCFRDHVSPVPGSVVYCDLFALVEHSGIHIGEGIIANIEVDGLCESTVYQANPHQFTSKSKLSRKIYVSSNAHGAVGDPSVASGAISHIGEKGFYGYVFKNCHTFSSKCLTYAKNKPTRNFGDPIDQVGKLMGISETWEPTMAALKSTAKLKLGATKWRLWDWDGELKNSPSSPPDWEVHNDYFQNLVLNRNTIEYIRDELFSTREYENEIADENIPKNIREKLEAFGKLLENISKTYDDAQKFLDLCPEANFTYMQISTADENLSELANEIQKNLKIQELVRKLGRNYISEEKKKQVKVPQMSHSEVYGTHRSDDLIRMMPSELLNLEDESLEVVFYARLLEKNLLTYELQGATFTLTEDIDTSENRTGPVVVCVDTSGSMKGKPLLKAKALLLAIANILKKENRVMHVLLFGSKDQIEEFSLTDNGDAAELLAFLQQGFGGGTDFETPLNHAFDIISSKEGYEKADILMVSDGDGLLSNDYIETVKSKKEILNCAIYSVLCAGKRAKDSFSDEIILL